MVLCMANDSDVCWIHSMLMNIRWAKDHQGYPLLHKKPDLCHLSLWFCLLLCVCRICPVVQHWYHWEFVLIWLMYENPPTTHCCIIGLRWSKENQLIQGFMQFLYSPDYQIQQFILSILLLPGCLIFCTLFTLDSYNCRMILQSCCV